MAVTCCVKWLFWPVSVAVLNRIGRYLLREMAVPARITGRYEPRWPLVAVWRGSPGPYRWPLRAVLAGMRRAARLFWPISLAGMSRTGRYLLCEVAALARVGGRYGPCWPLFAVWRGCAGPCRWPL